MQGKLSLTTPAHVFAASHAVRKNIAEKLKVRKVETNEYEAVLSEDPAARRTTLHEDSFDILQHYPTTVALKPAFCLPLQEIDVLVNCQGLGHPRHQFANQHHPTRHRSGPRSACQLPLPHRNGRSQWCHQLDGRMHRELNTAGQQRILQSPCTRRRACVVQPPFGPPFPANRILPFQGSPVW